MVLQQDIFFPKLNQGKPKGQIMHISIVDSVIVQQGKYLWGLLTNSDWNIVT